MTSQNIKNEIVNNIIVAMHEYLDSDSLHILEKILVSELVRVNMEEITTLPAIWHDNADKRNQYIIQLFDIKKKLKANTKYNYISAIKRLVTLIQKPLDKMDTTDIYYYLNWYENKNALDFGKKNQATTVNNERRFLSAFFTWMRKEKIIIENPVEAIEPRRQVRKPIDYFRPKELAKLKDACQKPRERALVEVLRSTGARIGELAEIKLEQIDWATGDIMIIGEKSDRYRPLYLDDDAQYYYKMYLESRKDSAPYMFTQETGSVRGKMSTAGLRGVLKNIGKRAGLKCRVYPHKLRKTLGMQLMNKGIDIGTISEIMGHADTKVTSEYYAQSTPKTLRYIRERAA